MPGRRPALEAVRAGRARSILLSADARSTTVLRELLEAASAAGVPVRRVEPDMIEDLAGDAVHQGVVARVAIPPPLGEAELSRRAWGPDATVVVLDGVADPRNLGAVARTAEAAGCQALVVRHRRGGALSAVALRASAGALLHLSVVTVPNLPRALQRLQGQGFWVLGLDERAVVELGGAERPPGPLALVLGAEGEGLGRLVREVCDDLVRIPMRGHVSSLNVSVAAGVALFALAVAREAGDA